MMNFLSRLHCVVLVAIRHTYDIYDTHTLAHMESISPIIELQHQFMNY